MEGFWAALGMTGNGMCHFLRQHPGAKEEGAMKRTMSPVWGALSSLLLAALATAQTGTHPVLQVLAPERPSVSSQLLEQLKKVHIENAWSVLGRHGYRHQFVDGFIVSQPDVPLVGRAVTLRYLPVRPDLEEALKTIGRQTDHSPVFNVRAAEEAKPGDVIVVEEGGMVKDATFMGDVTATGIRARGAAGVIIDGGTRDWDTLRAWKDLPIYARGVDATAQAAQIGVDWNVPIRLGDVTVMPGDIILGTAEGVVVIPPQFVEEVVRENDRIETREDFERLQMQEGTYRARDIYPMNQELEKLFQEWLKTRQTH
jgi:4-hydroxy-4-methyl-2-oxoglutarate aldolase